MTIVREGRKKSSLRFRGKFGETVAQGAPHRRLPSRGFRVSPKRRRNSQPSSWRWRTQPVTCNAASHIALWHSRLASTSV